MDADRRDAAARAREGAESETGEALQNAYYSGPWAELYQGDCVEVLRRLPESLADAVVCDPPYGLSGEPDISEVLSRWMAGEEYGHRWRAGFMGERWDSFVVGPNTWKAVLRALKPGGYLLCFAGTRTRDLAGVALRLAGFDIEESIAWITGQGFPKSLNVEKALTRMQGERRRALGMVPLDGPESANRHKGLGTALKPTHECIVVARRPLAEPNVSRNVLKQGTGTLNIDACRIGVEEDTNGVWGSSNATVNPRRSPFNGSPDGASYRSERYPLGRWPANLVLSCCELEPDEAPCPDCPVAELDGQSGLLKSGANPERRYSDKFRSVYGEFRGESGCVPARGADAGGASRFFFCAKASRAEREEGLDGFEERPLLWSSGAKNPGSFQSGTKRASANPHPTLKPRELMRWLIRLVARPGARILDPFGGSGTTGVAATLEGVHSVLIEREAEYLPIARARLEHAAARGPEHVQEKLPLGFERPPQEVREPHPEEEGKEGFVQEELPLAAESCSRNGRYR